MSPPSNTPTHPPSISRRLSIRFLPHPPSTEQVEPTDTLVLNGGGTTNLFTDFRPLREDQTKCEWAFAGVKKFLDDGRCQWDHLVDNRASETETEDDSDILPDIGHCSTAEDGTEVEHGMMLNSETGKVEEYVEVWKDEHVPSGSRVLVLRLERADEEDAETRGIFVMVGNYAQVVVRNHLGVSATRWLFSKGWKELQSYGDQSHWQTTPFPRGDTLLNTTVDVPQKVVFGDLQWTWRIAEDYTWSPYIQS